MIECGLNSNQPNRSPISMSSSSAGGGASTLGAAFSSFLASLGASFLASVAGAEVEAAAALSISGTLKLNKYYFTLIQ